MKIEEELTSRHVAYNKRKEKKRDRFQRNSIILFLLISFSVIGLIVYKYQTTQNWESSKLSGQFQDVPPEFAKNTYSLNMVQDVKRLSDVTSMLQKIDKTNGLTRSDLSDAKSVLHTSQSILKKYNVTGGKSLENQNNLELDIEEYNIEQTAYSKIDPEALNHVISGLTTRQSKSASDADSAMLKRLSNIAEDYQNLNDFVDTYMPKLGEVKDDNLQVDTNVNQKITDEMIQQIQDKRLTRFKNIKTLNDLLVSTRWSSLLQNNTNFWNQQAWQKIQAQFDQLNQNQYLAVSDIKTLKDANTNHLSVDKIDSKDGFTVSDASPVKFIKYDGKTLTQDQYFAKSTKVEVQVDPVYKPNNSNN